MGNLIWTALRPRPWLAALVVAAALLVALAAGAGAAVTADPSGGQYESQMGALTEQPLLATEEGDCMVDRFNELVTGVPGKTKKLNCTSNDVRLATYELIAGPPTCVLDDDIDVVLKGQFIATSDTRWDVGVFVSQDGLTPNRLGGVCYNDFLHYASLDNTDLDLIGGAGPFYNGELTGGAQDLNDTCGDIEQGKDAFLITQEFTIICQDSDGNGQADVPSCTVWNNSGATTPSCTSELQTTANTTAKCTCENVPIVGLSVRPGLVTSASGPVTVGQTITDTATLSGGDEPTGTIDFSVFAPGDTTCSTPLSPAPASATVNGNGSYTSGPYTTTTTGTYRWIASYSGDTKNVPVSTSCNDANESSTVIPFSPSLSTTASQSASTVGATLNDSATLSGYSPTGTLTFKLFSPSDSTCSGTPDYTQAVTVSGNGSYSTSPGFVSDEVGEWRWVVTYSGDTNNDSFTSACGATNESSTVVKFSPSIATVLSATSVSTGTPVTDSATFTGASPDAGGSVTYTVYTDSACTLGAQSAGTKTVTNGVIPNSDAITFSDGGTYYWQAAYSGDAKNEAATSDCTSEIVVVRNSPSMSTAQNLLPNDDATLSGATGNAGGTITFELFDPTDATCSGTPAYDETVNVSGNGIYSTSNTDFYASDVGTWRWKVEYSGDTYNDPASSACGEEFFTIDN